MADEAFGPGRRGIAVACRVDEVAFDALRTQYTALRVPGARPQPFARRRRGS